MQYYSLLSRRGLEFATIPEKSKQNSGSFRRHCTGSLDEGVHKDFIQQVLRVSR